MMLCSGRRAIDIIRIESGRVCRLGRYKYKIILPHDKKNDHEIEFVANLEAIPPTFRPTCLDKINSVLVAELNRESWPFKSCADKNLSRSLNFHPHGIRSLVSIYLTLLGLSDEQIMRVVGWQDRRSLLLYRRIERYEMGGKSLDELIVLANRR